MSGANDESTPGDKPASSQASDAPAGLTLEELSQKYGGAPGEPSVEPAPPPAAQTIETAEEPEAPAPPAEVFQLTSPGGIVDEDPSAEELPDGAAIDGSEGGPEQLSEAQLTSVVESLLFAADKPLAWKQLAELIGTEDIAAVRAAVATLEQRYATAGIQLHAVAGGFQFRTNPDNAVWVQRMLATKPVKLSRAQLEALAICAYRQPITRPEIDDIRGVDSGAALRTLMDRSLIRILGKKEEPGRPLLYGTTKEFLEFFNLGDLKDLPTLREFHELSDEHRAQVEALEGKAAPGTVETQAEAEANRAATRPLSRIEWKPVQEDQSQLAEIDRLIDEADKKAKLQPDPHAPPVAADSSAPPASSSKDPS